MTSRRSTGLLALALALAAAPAHAVVLLPSQFINEPIVGGLNEPNSMAFLPDGRMLFTEQRNGRIRMVVNGHIAATDPIAVVPSLNASGYERGLQGIAVDPRWPQSPYVYVYYNRLGGSNRIARFTAAGDLANPTGENITLGSMLLMIDNVPDADPNHNSGCLRFGEDGKLYVSVGEDEDWCSADDLPSLKGKILRLDVERLPAGGGGPVPRSLLDPGDNPMSVPDSNARLVYAYGMRNPWRFHIDPTTSLLYGADVGEDINEELNEIAAGDYMGWPYREGNTIIQRANCPEPGGAGSTPYKVPVISMSRTPSLTSIIAIGVYRPVPGATSAWPKTYWGQLFYGEHYSGFVKRLQRGTGGAWSPAPAAPGQPNGSDWATGFKAVVDCLVGPDGSLWWLRQFDDSMAGPTGSLQRIRYTGAPADTPISGPMAASLQGRPNPFASDVELSFRLASSAYVRLELFDMSGRLVRRLVDATLPAGEQRITWNGEDRGQRAVPPGVYLARLEVPGAIETARVLRIE